MDEITRLLNSIEECKDRLKFIDKEYSRLKSYETKPLKIAFGSEDIININSKDTVLGIISILRGQLDLERANNVSKIKSLNDTLAIKVSEYNKALNKEIGAIQRC